jgi:hypothetical protein
MSFKVNRISIFTTDIPAGQHLLTITDAKMHKKSNGEYILNNGNPGIILTYSSEGLTHQEIYWIEGTNYHLLQKILSHIGLDPTTEIHKKDMIGKQFWGSIVEYVTMNGTEEIKKERRLKSTSDKRMKDEDYTVFVEHKFDAEGPAF